MEDRSKRLVKNTAILTFGNLCTKGIMFIMTPLFTKWLTQADYGTFDLLVTYISLLTPLVTLEIGEAVFRFLVGKNTGIEDETIISNAIVSNIISLSLALACLLVMATFLPQFKYIAMPYSAMVISEVAYNFCTKVARGMKKMNVYVTANILYVFVMAISSFLAVYFLKGGLVGLLYSYSIGYFVSFVYMLVKCRILTKLSLSALNMSAYIRMCKYSLPLLPNAIAWWIVNVSDRTLVSVLLGTELNAILSVTNKLPNLCQQFYRQFSFSWQETVVDTIDSSDRDIYISKILNQVFQLMGTLIILLLGMNYYFFKILFSEEYFFGYYLSPVLLVAILIYMLAQTLGGIYIGQMNTKRNGFTTTISAAINLVIHLSLIKFIGLWAAVISTFVAYSSLLIIRFYDIRKDICITVQKKSLFIAFGVMYYVAVNYVMNVPSLHFVNVFLALVIFGGNNAIYVKSIAFKLRSKMK